MRGLLSVIAAISLLASLGTCAVAKGAPHEIEAQLWFLIFVIAGIGAAVLDVLQQIREAVKPQASATPVPEKTAVKQDDDWSEEAIAARAEAVKRNAMGPSDPRRGS